MFAIRRGRDARFSGLQVKAADGCDYRAAESCPGAVGASSGPDLTSAIPAAHCPWLMGNVRPLDLNIEFHEAIK